MRKFNDLSGKRFGRLKVMGDFERAGRYLRWKCVCDCGNIIKVTSNNLWGGHTRSCGCLRTEMKTKHGMYKTSVYSAWSSLKARCSNKNHVEYKNYGGRGITVCVRWKKSFLNFYKDMGDRPEGREIDRINNNGNYEPKNCRWATQKENANNKRTCKMITFNGKTKTMKQWAEALNVSPVAIRLRICRGWKIKDVLTVPIHSYFKHSINFWQSRL